MADLSTGTNQGICSVRKLGSQWVQPRTLSYNPAERAVLVTSVSCRSRLTVLQLTSVTGDGEWPVRARQSSEIYCTFSWRWQGRSIRREERAWKQCDLCRSESNGSAGQGWPGMSPIACVVRRAERGLQNIEIRDLSNNLTKSVKCPVQTNEIFYGGTASLILSAPTSVVLFDIQQQKVLAELNTPPVKYVVWSIDGNMVALLSKHSEPVTIVSRAQLTNLSHHHCQQVPGSECFDP